MPRFLKSSIIILFFIAISSSCFSQQVDSNYIHHNIFLVSEESYLFKSNLQYEDNNWNGILAIKHSQQSEYEIIWMDAYGKTLIDATLKNGLWKYHYLLPELDKWMLRKVIKNDFMNLLLDRMYIRDVVNVEDTIIYLGKGKKCAYRNEQLIYLEDTKGVFSKVLISFNNDGRNIEIAHKDKGLNILLERIEASELSVEVK